LTEFQKCTIGQIEKVKEGTC